MSVAAENISEICVIVPTYNNARFLKTTLEDILQYAENVIVINDGSTDGTARILEKFENRITVFSCGTNKGKGYALRRGFDIAESSGFRYAITMDSDGQHAGADLPVFYKTIAQNPDNMLIGCRLLKQKNMPAANTFANKFSNFWFTVQTGKRLPDTQTGFRLYPLRQMRRMRPLGCRYEAELELLVRLAWSNVGIIPLKINVEYPDDRITHFRPVWDFLRISMLNTLLCILAVIYGYPKRLFLWIKNKIIAQ
ncbi:MAG: glycosyltransferase family 2 protein [Prevotellaceae bacterium]|jgi:glycosyltransferase involved in cell wall biosynthesis|nr:glycosyltransferase family 2 protein [Prevotellaceae bacterium]